MGKSKQIYFYRKWLQDPQYSSWLVECKDSKVFGCKKCKKYDIKLSSMGIAALKSHLDSTKHKGNCAVAPKALFQKCKVADKSRNSSKPGPSKSVVETVSPTKPTAEVRLVVDGTQKMIAELMWVVHSVSSNASFRSAAVGNFFPTMFPDSEIAQKFSLQKDKISYLLKFAIFPYLKEI